MPVQYNQLLEAVDRLSDNADFKTFLQAIFDRYSAVFGTTFSDKVPHAIYFNEGCRSVTTYISKVINDLDDFRAARDQRTAQLSHPADDTIIG